MEELVIQMNGRITKNVDLSVKNVKTSCMSKKYDWNPAICSCDNGNYLASIMNDLAIICYNFIASSNNF